MRSASRHEKTLRSHLKKEEVYRIIELKRQEKAIKLLR